MLEPSLCVNHSSRIATLKNSPSQPPVGGQLVGSEPGEAASWAPASCCWLCAWTATFPPLPCPAHPGSLCCLVGPRNGMSGLQKEHSGSEGLPEPLL
ncbi:unnamed protein product [Nyctereutes procyonoides]|uniref:(raccoon dog) hypothetical protein n=1 Tax=Nyctereutes procyonoides TaxID=34880 RepID=A0A811XUX0_NYCPR|nr:unnamed protein product [Nyctereutes procyonoides]